MAGILLVHGGWHGPWCWDGVAERLTGHGHQVGTVRLAAASRTQPEIYAGMGHNLMLDQG